MAEQNPTPAVAQESGSLLQKPEPATAGGKLRAAREAAGLDLAALAAALKVPAQKLQALEEDHYDQLPDIAFTRGLALTICRRLKVDPAGVLALLPELPTRRVPHEGLNAPFKASDSRGPSLRDGSGERSRLSWPAVVVIILLLAALAVYFLPSSLLDRVRGAATSADAAPAAPADTEGQQPGMTTEPVNATEPGTTVETPADATPAAEPSTPPAPGTPVDATAQAASAAAAPAELGKPLVEANANVTGGVISFAASGDSWITVRSPSGDVLATRRLRAGETLNLPNVEPPFRVVVGNTRATTVTLRGQPYDLKPFERGNVARFEVN